MKKQSFLDRFIERVDAIDANSLQAYILHLSREKGFFETVFNAVQEGILVVDRNLRIQYHNQAAKDLLALPDDLSKLRLSQLLPGINWHQVLRLDANAWVRLSRQEVEITYPDYRVIQFYLIPSDEVKGFATVILRDVTESRNRSREELESARSEVVEMLAAGVAHEIGNPLNSLSLNLQLLKRQIDMDTGNIDKKDCLDMLEACTAEVERLDHIIRQFLQAFRGGEMDGSPIDLRELLGETLKFMQREFDDRNISVETVFPRRLPPVNGDQARLKQAFFNILRNAMQAMPAGGMLQISLSSDEHEIRVEFTDSGSGISPDKITRIFDPFTSFRPGGTGIGMMIIQKVLRSHGAKIELQTIPEKGTALVVVFPRAGDRVRMLAVPPSAVEEDITVEAAGEEEGEGGVR